MSIVFYKWILGQEETLNLEDLAHIDIDLYQQFKKLQSIIYARNKLMLQELNQQQITNKLIDNKKYFKTKDDISVENSNLLDNNNENLLFDGCQIDDLSLIFTLPGYPNIELKKGGKDCLVTIENLDQYVNVRNS